MTPTPPLHARPAHQGVTQRQGTLMTASGVCWGDLQLPQEEQALPPVSRVNLGSLLAWRHHPVPSAHLAEPMVTLTRPLNV